VSGSESKSPIDTVTECLNLCHDGTNVRRCWGIVFKNSDTYLNCI